MKLHVIGIAVLACGVSFVNPAFAAKPTGALKTNQITEEKLSKVQRLNELAQQRGQSLAQMAIAWVLRHPVMTSALIGASKVSQVEECVAALDQLDFSADELRAIEGILAEQPAPA